MIKTSIAIISFIKRKVLLGLRIPKDALVLDLGSGEKPFWRADVYVDDIEQGNHQRATDKPIQTDLGYFVNANAEKLPFPDNTFDYVFCAHLLEHVNNPDLVISEIIRVTKESGGGYIEVPNAVIEVVSPHDGHIWNIFFNKHKEKLILLRKSRSHHYAIKENLSYVLGRKKCLQYGLENIFIQLFWKKNSGINYEIFDELKDDCKYVAHNVNEENIKDETKTININLYKLLRVFLRKISFLKNDSKLDEFTSSYDS